MIFKRKVTRNIILIIMLRDFKIKLSHLATLAVLNIQINPSSREERRSHIFFGNKRYAIETGTYVPLEVL